MSRLYDRIMEAPYHLMRMFGDDGLVDAMKHATVVLADNVSEYYWQVSAKETWDIGSDFPNVALPWPVAFIQWRIPETRNEGGRMLANIDRDVHAGCLLLASDAPSGSPFRWACRALVFHNAENNHGYFTAPGIIHFQVDEDGSIRPKNDDPSLTHRITFSKTASAQAREYWLSRCGSAIHVPLLAISFMHCKNVSLTPNDADEKLNRARIKRGKKPLSRFYTLNIEPMKQVLQTEGGIQHNGLKRALHICRGHFAEYGDTYGKGRLFGKYEGRYWVPSIVKGNAKEGVVFKDYNVRAPAV